MMIRTSVAAGILIILNCAATAAEKFDPFALPFEAADLRFPPQAQPFGTDAEDMLFKPEGRGPFPALVVMPTCSGRSNSLHMYDWARRALARGYAVLVVDPLSQRGARSNCSAPRVAPHSRLLKDAFDAAGHLRKQPFVDPARIALIGFSQGANAALGASGSIYARRGGSEPFRAIVAVYPVCLLEKFPISAGKVADINFVPDKIVVPLFAEIGAQDTEAGSAMNGCPAVFDRQKQAGSPVEYRIYDATHAWDWRELGDNPDRTHGVYGQDVIHSYSVEATERSAEDAFAFLEQQMTAP